MLRFDEKKVTKEEFYCAKEPINIEDVNVDNIFISNSIKMRNQSSI